MKTFLSAFNGCLTSGTLLSQDGNEDLKGNLINRPFQIKKLLEISELNKSKCKNQELNVNKTI